MVDGVVEPFDRVGQEGCVMRKADEAVRKPTADFGQVFVAAAGDETDAVDAVRVQLFDPAPGLRAVAGVVFLLLRCGKSPHAAPMLAVGATAFLDELEAFFADAVDVVLHGVAHVGEPGSLGGEMGVEVDDVEAFVHENPLVFLPALGRFEAGE